MWDITHWHLEGCVALEIAKVAKVILLLVAAGAVPVDTIPLLEPRTAQSK